MRYNCICFYFFLSLFLIGNQAIGQTNVALADTLFDKTTGFKFVLNKERTQISAMDSAENTAWKSQYIMDKTDSLIFDAKNLKPRPPEKIIDIKFSEAHDKKVLKIIYTNNTYLTLEATSGKIFTKWKD